MIEVKKAQTQQPYIVQLVFITLLCSFLSTKFNCLLAQETTLKFEHIKDEHGLPQNTIHGIAKDKYGFMWFGTWTGLCKYDGYKFTIYRAEPGNENSISNNRIHYIFRDSSDFLWISTYDEKYVCRYNYETDDFTRISVDKLTPYIKRNTDRTIHYRNPVSSGRYNWHINNNHSLVETDEITLKSKIYYCEPSKPWSLNDDYTTDIYLDETDILWIGTFSNGINKADLNHKPFKHYFHNTNTTQSLVDDNIRAITKDNYGNLWIGTRGKGVTRIDRNGNHYTYQHSKNKASSLINNEIRCIYNDKNGFVWIGSKFGLNRLNVKINKIAHYTFAKGLPSETVYSLLEDSYSNLWACTWKGLSIYNPLTDRFEYFQIDSINAKYANHTRIIYESKNKDLWIGTEGSGMYQFRYDKEKIRRIKHYSDNVNKGPALSDSRVYTITQDPLGYMWIGTGNGLNRLNPKTGSIQHFHTKDGLPDVMIMGILTDNNNNIWVSHKRGLTRINIHTLVMRNYTYKDGLQSNEFSENACFKDEATGWLYFGGNKGMNVFLPSTIKDNPYLPKIEFTGLHVLNKPVNINDTINGKVILDKSIILTDTIELNHTHKSFTLEFAALHYTNPKGNKYAYMLEGFDKRWIETDADKRTASYSNLDAGVYTFKVKGSNSDGLWNPEPTVMTIVVHPPFWETSLAYGLYTIVIFLSLYLVYKYLVSRGNLKNEILFERMRAEKIHEMDVMKINFFTNVSHELRTPMTLIIDPLERIISEKTVNLNQAKHLGKLMHKNVQRLSNLVDELLDFRKFETGNMILRPEYNDIAALAKAIAGNFEFHAVQHNISFHFHCPTPSIKICYDPQQVEKVFYNLLSNAFKYTPDGGAIILSLDIIYNSHDSSSFVEIRIKDSGKGINPSEKNRVFEMFFRVNEKENFNIDGSGIGLALTKEIVELHQGTIQVESTPGEGSTFIVKLPLIKDPGERPGFLPATLQASLEPHTQAQTEPLVPLVNHHNFSTLLIIEDNDDIRTYLKAVLSINFHIIEASSGNAGWEKAQEEIPDLIVSDIMMPGTDGITLCKKIKMDERTCHIPIILLTAKHSDEFKIEGYSMGADAYVTKPFNSKVLVSQINNMLESRKKLSEIFQKEGFNKKGNIHLHKMDQVFFEKATKIIHAHLDNMNFDIEVFASEMKLSRTQLYRKMKAVANQTPHDYISSFRLAEANKLLQTGEFTIAEIAYKVGYSEPSNFTRSYTKRFGKAPSQFLKASDIRKS